MAELLSVGLDVGTTTTQLVVSELQVENRASGFAVPEMEIIGRRIRYRGPVHMTPLADDTRVDGSALAELLDREYTAAGIRREAVDTGAVIVTGETSRKENARRVLEAISEYAGKFVVATAGPHLESVLAARGSGAVEWSRETGKTVLHMDIGGGTANLALIREGRILRTGCLNVGGRLLKFSGSGEVTYVSAVLGSLWSHPPGELPADGAVTELCRRLAEALEMAAGLREPGPLLEQLTTRETGAAWEPPEEGIVISFSGGVADCIGKDLPPQAFGDMGPQLGRAIRESRLCRGEYMLGAETIRATVIGAGCHSTALSGSTVFYREIRLPVKDLPVAVFTEEEQEASDLPEKIRQRLDREDSDRVVLAFPGWEAPAYRRVTALAEAITLGAGDREVWVALEADMAKALGQALWLRRKGGCLCIDRVRIPEGSFLDVGEPVGPCLPVVIKTLVMRSDYETKNNTVGENLSVPGPERGSGKGQ